MHDAEKLLKIASYMLIVVVSLTFRGKSIRVLVRIRVGLVKIRVVGFFHKLYCYIGTSGWQSTKNAST